MTEPNESKTAEGEHNAKGVGSTDWLEPCPACHRVWGNPTIKHDADDVTFFIRCGSCGHEAPGVSLKPAIANWNGSNEKISYEH